MSRKLSNLSQAVGYGVIFQGEQVRATVRTGKKMVNIGRGEVTQREQYGGSE
jgi:hypothetical protein